MARKIRKGLRVENVREIYGNGIYEIEKVKSNGRAIVRNVLSDSKKTYSIKTLQGGSFINSSY